MTSESLVWAITGMVRNQGLLLSNIEIIRSAANPHLVDLTFVANDDDPLATDPFLDVVDRFGARVVRLPRGRNGSWDPVVRQARQLEYAWTHGGLSQMGATTLVRSRTDLWLRRSYVDWVCEGFAGQSAPARKVLVRGVHPTLPGYAEDLILAAPTSALDLLIDVRPELVPSIWRSHRGMMVHLARFVNAYVGNEVLDVYEEALNAVVSRIQARPLGALHLKAVVTTLPGGMWQLHQAALGLMARKDQLLDFLVSIQAVAEATFSLPPENDAPGHGLDRGEYLRRWSPSEVRRLVDATSTDFVATEEEMRLWGDCLRDSCTNRSHGLEYASTIQPPRQRIPEAAFLGAERSARRVLHRAGSWNRRAARAVRRRLPSS